MDDYFKLPSGYACISRNGDQIYAYSSNYLVRDTYELDNFKYYKVSTSQSNYAYNPNICLPSSLTHLIPSSLSGFVFLSVSIFICVLISGLFYVFRR